MRSQRLDGLGQLLQSLSYESVLRRGYALVRDAKGQAIISASAARTGDEVALQFHDGNRGAKIVDNGPSPQGKLF